MRRIMFTGGGGAGSQGLYRHLSPSYEVLLADADPRAIADFVPAAQRIAIPKATDDDFPQAVAEACHRLRVDILVPGVDEELERLPRVAELAPETRILLPAPDFVATMLDKLDFVRALGAAGIDVPHTETADRAAEVGFPCILKPRRGRGSRGVHVVENRLQVDAYLALYDCPASDIVAQELVKGREFTVTVAADPDATLFAIAPVLVHSKRGVTIAAETANEGPVRAACEAIHAARPTPGIYNVQCMVTEAGRVVPFEINPRVSTTFCLALAALPVDPIAVALGLARRGDGIALPAAGVSLRRYWQNEISGA